jgi:hypothetical protein
MSTVCQCVGSPLPDGDALLIGPRRQVTYFLSVTLSRLLATSLPRGVSMSAAVRLTVLTGRIRRTMLFWSILTVVLLPRLVSAQSSQPDSKANEFSQNLSIHPITSEERQDWIVDAIVGPKSLGLAAGISTWKTVTNSPHEWTGASGFAKRYMAIEAHTAISKGLEGGLGALWNEDPRPMRSGRQGFWPRIGFAMTTVVMAPRSDGHLAPAWARFAGNAGSSLMDNAWLPSRLKTPGRTAKRFGDGLLGRLMTNLWTEFSPDLRKRFSKRKASAVSPVRAERP